MQIRNKRKPDSGGGVNVHRAAKRRRPVLPRPLTDLPDDLPYFPSALTPEQVAPLMAEIEGYFPPTRSICTVYGKQHTVPRDQVGLGTGQYTYSGHSVECKPWTGPILTLKTAVEALWYEHRGTRVDFNFLLINGYNVTDRVGWHQDNEPSIDQQRPICSVSLGATRDFDVALSKQGGGPDLQHKYRCALFHRDVVFMSPGVQSKYYHQVPARTRPQGRRYNLTFRVTKGTKKT